MNSKEEEKYNKLLSRCRYLKRNGYAFVLKIKLDMKDPKNKKTCGYKLLYGLTKKGFKKFGFTKLAFDLRRKIDKTLKVDSAKESIKK